VPLILEANPRLLGYYRLLYGFSQKEFYTAATGVARFHSMEKGGVLTKINKGELAALCAAMAPAGHALLDGIGANRLSRELLDDLTLLTLGPQLRGGANVKKGAVGIVKVFDAIHRQRRGNQGRSGAYSDQERRGPDGPDRVRPRPGHHHSGRDGFRELPRVDPLSRSRADRTFPISTTASARPRRAIRKLGPRATSNAGPW